MWQPCIIYIRIPIKSPTKDPGFLNQVPALEFQVWGLGLPRTRRANPEAGGAKVLEEDAEPQNSGSGPWVLGIRVWGLGFIGLIGLIGF